MLENVPSTSITGYGCAADGVHGTLAPGGAASKFQMRVEPRNADASLCMGSEDASAGAMLSARAAVIPATSAGAVGRLCHRRDFMVPHKGRAKAARLLPGRLAQAPERCGQNPLAI